MCKREDAGLGLSARILRLLFAFNWISNSATNSGNWSDSAQRHHYESWWCCGYLLVLSVIGR